MQTARQLSSETYIGRAEVFLPARKIKTQTRQFPVAGFLTAIFFIFGLSFIHVYQQALVDQNSSDISQLRTAIAQQENANAKLRVQDMMLQSPGRLEQIADVSLGMVKPEKVSYIVLPAQSRSKKTNEPKKRGILADLQVLWQQKKI